MTAYDIAIQEFNRLRRYSEAEWGKKLCQKYHEEIDTLIRDENTMLVASCDILVPAIDQNKLEDLVKEQLREKGITFNLNQVQKICMSLRVIGSAYKNEFGL